MASATLTGIRVPKPVSWLGAVSYPLYLVHQNIGLLLIRETTALSPELRVLAACLGSIGLAALIHYSVEFRHQKLLTRLASQSLAGLMSIGGLRPVRIKAS
jgi:peptidoglycan/LPS O-acetylase OafA/YrhL